MKRIALLGPGADDQWLLQGDYHYPAHFGEEVAPDPSAALGDEDLLPNAVGAFARGPYFTPHVTPLAGLSALTWRSWWLRARVACAGR
mgnify:CR=1 FL=1